jgi:hypothetical protein
MITAIRNIIECVRDYLDGFYDINGIRGLARDIVSEIAAI